AQVDHRIKAASEEIVGHVGALQLPGFESDRYDFWEFTQRSAPGDPLRCLALLRFAWPTHYKGFNTTTSSSAPRFDIGILPHGVCHLSFPFAFEARFSRSIPKPVLSSCRLYTDCHRARNQVSSRLILEQQNDPSFDSALYP
ncbi:hypothetical protein, partial [Burkholderia ubonensis]|uniref:hypothetical protein n=1 Tax=Burkholderia ubonensis TaxID=101571 RepID=UPI001C42FC2A